MRGACDCAMSGQMWDESSLGGSRERGGIDMMVYSIAKDPEWGGQRKSNVAKIGRDATLPSAVRKMPRVEGAVGKLAVTSRGGKEKKGKIRKDHSKPYWTAILHAS